MADLFAFLGEARSESLYMSGASSGTAMTRAAIAAMVIRDFVEGARVPGQVPYAPSSCYTPRESYNIGG